MLATVSPVIVGAAPAPPQPTTPSSVSTRASTFSALVTSSNAILRGFTMGRLTARASMRLIFMSVRCGMTVDGRSELANSLDGGGHALVVGVKKLPELRRVAVIRYHLDVFQCLFERGI